jgi:hypothetical protein
MANFGIGTLAVDVVAAVLRVGNASLVAGSGSVVDG